MLQMGLSQNRFPIASTEAERYKRKLSACWRPVALMDSLPPEWNKCLKNGKKGDSLSALMKPSIQTDNLKVVTG